MPNFKMHGAYQCYQCLQLDFHRFDPGVDCTLLPANGNRLGDVHQTPFLWNGTDNIVVDTAFGLTSAWSSSGTVQYTSVTSGYRYMRSDSADYSDMFSGGA